MSDQEISTQVVVILLIPVVAAVGLMGYVIVDSLQVRQPAPTGPDSSVIFEDHPDQLNRTASGEGIVTGRLEGETPLAWNNLTVEVMDPRSDTVIVSFSAQDWTTRDAGQTIALYTNGTVPQEGETLSPSRKFVLRDVHDDQDSSEDIINPCNSFVFRMKHAPTDTVLGSYKTTFVTADWAPGTSCDDENN